MSRFLTEVRQSAATSKHQLVSGAGDAAVELGWKDVYLRAQRVAGALQASGVSPGDSVAVLAAEAVDVAPATLGIWLSGAGVTMLHQPTPRTDLEHWAADSLRILDLLDTRVVLIGPPFAEFVAGSFQANGISEYLVSDLSDQSEHLFSEVEVPDDAIALNQLTSGSTSDPKAVRITHRNLYANVTDTLESIKFDTDEDVLISWLPLAHDMGMIGAMALPMMTGAGLVAITPGDFLQRPMVWAELIQKYRGTMTAAPNFAYALLVKQLERSEPGEFDLSSLRLAFNGGEPVDIETTSALTDVGSAFGLRPEVITPCYGSAESTMATSYGRSDEPMGVDVVDAEVLEAEGRAVPCDPQGPRRVLNLPKLGEPLPNSRVRVVDPDGQVLGERVVGTLEIQGASVTAGYLTADGPMSLTNDEGWCDTGDIGYLAEGEIVICGRSKDVIIIGGRNIYPSDVERAASRVEGVRTGNIIASRVGTGEGFPNETFVVFAESKHAGDAHMEEELSQAVAAAVAAEVGARPAAVRICQPRTMPKTPSGKLRRSAALEFL